MKDYVLNLWALGGSCDLKTTGHHAHGKPEKWFKFVPENKVGIADDPTESLAGRISADRLAELD